MSTTNDRTNRRRWVIIGVALAAVLAFGAGAVWAVAQANSGGSDSNEEDRPVAQTESAPAAPVTVPTDTPPTAAPTDFSSYSAPVAAQLGYLNAHWQDTASDQFGVLDASNCVNFASQSLLARGWTIDDEWWHSDSGNAYSHSTAWVSSTAFMHYLSEHPERATPLTDADRASVKVGDIVQFDWDQSGDRDHTGIVTSVWTGPDGATQILYAGHTDATWDRSVDDAITEVHPGGVAYYWSIPD